MPRAYVTVDVFSHTPFGGNQLAVVTEAEGLDTTTMQAIAAEFNYAETTFVLPPDDPAHTANVRIFTPGREVPFAGHPNIGTAYALSRIGEFFGRPVGDRVVFEEKVGLVPVAIQRASDGTPSGARLTAPAPFETGDEVDPAVVARCAGIDVSAVVTTRHAPVYASVGLPFVMAELASLEALSGASPDIAAFARESADFALHLYVPDVGKPTDVCARMFAPNHGVIEDPGTGSANAALAGLLASLASPTDSTLTWDILQGREMGRPSHLVASATKSGGAVTATEIGGACVPIMQGVIEAV